jgi:hypothetical protein
MSNASPPYTEIPKRLYTLAEFRRAGGPCRARRYELIRDGKMRAVKSGRSTMIPAAEFERYFAELPAMGTRS